MRSGELARLSGVSSDTLRHYERLGLLPKPPRTSGGYREYPGLALERVRLIRRGVGVGFSLKELTAIVKMRDGGRFPCREARALVAAKLADLKRQIKDLAAMRRQLEHILNDWDSRLAVTPKGRPARLLETLPDNGARPAPRIRFPTNSKE